MDEEDIFSDPTLKKKKKKKTGFDLNAALLEGNSGPSEGLLENGDVTECKEDSPEVEDLELFGKKKSKKKKKPFNLDELNDALPEIGSVEDVEDGSNAEAPSSGMLAADDDLNMDFSSKTKKKKKKKAIDEILAEGSNVGTKDEDRENEESGETWVDSDREYTYEELLDRAFNQLREKNPEMATGEKKKFVMKPPQVVRIGSKKTAFANFSEICRLLHRMPRHVLQFLLAELGTSGSIDGSNSQLIIKGRFQQKQIENVLRRYIKEYVTCHTCRSPDTILQKDARIYFLQCEQCNSRCSVAPIKSGFQAVANKQQRQAIRASKN